MKPSGTKGLLATGASAAWAKQRGATGFVSLVVEKLAGMEFSPILFPTEDKRLQFLT